jgi:hypothetical protein
VQKCKKEEKPKAKSKKQIAKEEKARRKKKKQAEPQKSEKNIEFRVNLAKHY